MCNCSQQTLQHEILLHKPDHQTFVESSSHHTDACSDKQVTDDLPLLEDEIASIDKRWNDLCATVGDRLQTVENVQEEIHRYQVVLRVTQKTIIEIEQIVTVEYVLVLDPNKAKQDLAEVKVRTSSTKGPKVSDLSNASHLPEAPCNCASMDRLALFIRGWTTFR